MKLLKEISFRLFIVLVMLSLVFVAYDMSKPIISSEGGILTQDVIQCIFDDTDEIENSVPSQGYNFVFNILLPILVYLASIGGFLYLLIEDFKLLKKFTKKNRLAKYLWILWMIVLVGLMLIPIFFGFQMVMKGFVLAVIATAIFLILIGILYWMSCKVKR